MSATSTCSFDDVPWMSDEWWSELPDNSPAVDDFPVPPDDFEVYERWFDVEGAIADGSVLEFSFEVSAAHGGLCAYVAPMDWAALVGREPPPRTWWIQDWLTPAPTLCAGAGGVGKTLLIQGVATALVAGKDYIGAPCQPLTVLAWLCEDDHDEIWRRQIALNSHFCVTPADLARLHVVPRIGQDNTILSHEFGKPMFTPLLAALREQVNDLRADVLILDNVAQVFGGTANDTHHVTKFVNGIRGMVSDRPFAPIFLHHPAKAAGSEYGGSVAWENAVRMRWYLGRDLPDRKQDEDAVESDVVFLARRKANYTNRDFRKLKFAGGILLPEESAPGTRFDAAARRELAERVVLNGFQKLAEIGVSTSDGKTSPNYLPRQILDKSYAQGFTKRELEIAMNKLMSEGRLKRGVVGQYENRSPRYGLVEGELI